MHLTPLWTLGSAQRLRHKAGRLTSARQWCRFRAISSSDHKQRGPFLHSALIASLLLVTRLSLTQVGNLLPDVLGRLPPRWASFLGTLFAKTLAGTADVNHVMSGLNMMIIPATGVSSVFYILVVCLVPHGGPRLRRGVSPGVLTALLNAALHVDYMSSMSVWTVSMLWRFPPPGGVEIPGLRLSDAWRMQFISGGLPNWNWYYLALLGNGLLGHWFLWLVGGWLFWALLAGEEVLKGVRLFHPLFFSRLAQPGDETFLFCGGFWVGLFCVLFGFVVLVLFLVSNCLIPFSSHKSCGVFQVSVEGHWTYSWTYVLALRVSLRLFNLDCRYPRDLLQPARKKKIPGFSGDISTIFPSIGSGLDQLRISHTKDRLICQ